MIANAPARRDHVIAHGLAPCPTFSPDVVVAPHLSIRAAAMLGEALVAALGRTLRPPSIPLRNAGPPDVPTRGRAVVCTDDIHGGGSARHVVRAARRHGLKIDRIVTLANFSGRRKIEGTPVFSLITYEFRVWTSAHCPALPRGITGDRPA